MSAFDELKSAIEGMQSGRFVLDIKCISANLRKFETEFSQLQARAESAEMAYINIEKDFENLEAEWNAMKEFVENIKETIELHESHWRLHIEKDLVELDAALKAGKHV